MKKLYTSFLALAVMASFSASAQQLPNSDFEGSWSKTTPYTGGSSKEVDGLSPEHWTVAHVVGFNFLGTWMGTTLVGDKTEGHNSGSALLVENVPNSVVKSQTVPGYATLGTPFNTANTSGKNKDGGTFGGIDYTSRPDALSLYYKFTQAEGTTEPANIVAYMWKGTVTQNNVRVNIASKPTTANMENRDRNIMDLETAYGDEPVKSADFQTIATINHAITAAAADWTELTIPFEYAEGATAAPEKINVILSAGNYFSTEPVEGNQLAVDDIRLIYYSRLQSINVAGADIRDFDPDVYSYKIDMPMPTGTSFQYKALGNSKSAKSTLSLDAANALATITVTNAQGADADGKSEHVYTIQFRKAEAKPVQYTGTLNIDIDMMDMHVSQTASVFITDNGNGTCRFLLPDFTLTLPDMEPANFGDILVDNVTMTDQPNGSVTYTGRVEGMSLADGEIIADVDLAGTRTGKHLQMTINVLWEGIPIAVTFNGNEGTSAIEGIEADTTTDAPAEYFNLQGIRVAADQLVPGIYIERQGNTTRKILVK